MHDHWPSSVFRPAGRLCIGLAMEYIHFMPADTHYHLSLRNVPTCRNLFPGKSLILTINQLNLPSMIQNLRLFWNFYKRLVVNNLMASVLLAIVYSATILLDEESSKVLGIFIRILCVSFMSTGFLMSLLYQELTHKTEYYFYHNKGISKLSLISVSALLNIPFGLITLLVYHGITS